MSRLDLNAGTDIRKKAGHTCYVLFNLLFCHSRQALQGVVLFVPFPQLLPLASYTWPARSSGKLPFSGGFAWILAPPNGFMRNVESKPIVVVVPGVVGNENMWHHKQEPLAKRTRRVLADEARICALEAHYMLPKNTHAPYIYTPSHTTTQPMHSSTSTTRRRVAASWLQCASASATAASILRVRGTFIHLERTRRSVVVPSRSYTLQSKMLVLIVWFLLRTSPCSSKVKHSLLPSAPPLPTSHHLHLVIYPLNTSVGT